MILQGVLVRVVLGTVRVVKAAAFILEVRCPQTLHTLMFYITL